MSIEEAIYIGDGDEKLMDIETARSLYLQGKIQLKKTFVCSIKNCKGYVSCGAFNIDSKKKYYFSTYGEHDCKKQSDVVNKPVESNSKINTESKVSERTILFEPDFKNKVKLESKNISNNKIGTENVTYKNTLPGEERSYKHNGKYTTIKRLVNLFINDKEAEIKVLNNKFKITEFIVELNCSNIMTEFPDNNISSGNIKNIYNKIFYLKGKVARVNKNYVVFSNGEIIHEGKKKKISIYIDSKVLNKKVSENKEYTFYCCEDIKITENFFTIFINNPNKIYIK